jgi:hypothetical protein
MHMFTALANYFKSEPEIDIDLAEANRVLRERTIHLFRHPHIAQLPTAMECNSAMLIKTKILRRQAFII